MPNSNVVHALLCKLCVLEPKTACSTYEQGSAPETTPMSANNGTCSHLSMFRAKEIMHLTFENVDIKASRLRVQKSNVTLRKALRNLRLGPLSSEWAKCSHNLPLIYIQMSDQAHSARRSLRTYDNYTHDSRVLDHPFGKRNRIWS